MWSLADIIIIIIIIIILLLLLLLFIYLFLSQSIRTIHTDSKESSVSRAAWTAFSTQRWDSMLPLVPSNQVLLVLIRMRL